MNGDTISTSATMPVASLGDHARLGAAYRMAWTMGHEREAAPVRRRDHGASTVAAGAARRERARAALLRLASDPAATPAERELALTRAAQLDGVLV